MATATDQVVLSREQAIDVIATIYAAGELLVKHMPETASDHPDFPLNDRIPAPLQELFADADDSSEAYETEPTRVEVEARSSEIEADVYEALGFKWSREVASNRRARAQRIREQKNITAR